MAYDALLDPSTLEAARALVTAIEAGDGEAANEQIAALSSLHESNLFNELGKLTREFHEALNTFRYDERISTLAEDDIPDAKQRLIYVITKTDDAAHKTLTAVEKSIPICESLGSESQKLLDIWQRFRNRELTPQEFRELSKQLSGFLNLAVDDTASIKGSLNEVLMAQDFQDLTGQIIRRVITLVDEVEKSLVNLVKLGGGLVKKSGEKAEGDGSALDGPQIPGMESKTIVNGQDDVDELLLSLGF